MPHPLPVRQVVVRRSQQGQSVTAIAQALGLVPRTVRHLLQRIRVQGHAAIAAPNPTTAAAPTPAVWELFAEALRLRREHPRGVLA